MKIYLKQNWSEQFIYGDKTPGFFVGREQEIESLKNIILGNTSSAVLIASVRGIGKTSFVHKTLFEIKNIHKNIHPVFVNIGHALENEDCKKNASSKKLVLISLIRAIHFNEVFKNDKKLEDLYDRCFGKYKEEREESKETNTVKNVGVKAELKTNGRTLIQLLSVLTISLGFYFNEVLLRILIGFLGIITLFLSFNWEKNWLQKTIGKKTLVIDDSTEYLEIEFENWLRSKEDKENKKIVFVIDELDKIGEEESLKAIKEYKNLFNRSFAHFLFLSSQKAFDLVMADREKDVKDGGIFPTLFTHTIYLSLPKSEELRNYLLQIFKPTNKSDENEKEELINYILFRSGNDFFDLKRNISDFILFDNDGEPFIDTNKIKEGDPNFSGVSKLFNYVDQWFLRKNLKELKKFWKENSLLQKSVFQFLNLNYNKNINEPVVEGDIQKLILFLVDIGILKTEEAKTETNKGITYQWTGKYNRGVQSPLLEEDKKYIHSFKKLIKLANDLNNLPKSYKTGKFEDRDLILEKEDGQNLTGVNLYSFFSEYKEIFNKLQNSSQRISVTVEKINESLKILDEQIDNVFRQYFNILVNTLNQILQNIPDIFINENINSRNYNINGIFGSLHNFLSVVTPEAYQSRIYGRTDLTKYVLIIRNFKDEDQIKNTLENLRNNTNILIVNLMFEDNYEISHPKVYKDKIGRNRLTGVEIKNFINFKFNDFRQLSKLLIKIEEHLGVDVKK